MALFRWRGDGAGTKSAWNDGRNWIDGSGVAYAQARYPGSILAASVTTWNDLTAYNVGDIVEPVDPVTNPYYYRCIDAGNSAAAEPAWPATLGDTVADDGVIWQNVGANSAYDDVALDTALAASALPPDGYNGITDETLQSLKIGKEYNGAVGSSASYLRVNVEGASSNGEVQIEGTAAGNIYLGEDVAPNNTVLCNVRILDGTVFLKSIIVNLICLKGNISIQDTSEIKTRFHIGYLVAQADTQVTIDSGVSVISWAGFGGLGPKITMTGGRVICNAAIFAGSGIEMQGGYWEQSGNCGGLVLTGGNFIWKSGTLTSPQIITGTVDGSQSQELRTLEDAAVYEAGILNLDDGIGNIDIASYIESIGGTIKFPRGFKLAEYVS